MSTTAATRAPQLRLHPLRDEADIQRVVALEAASYPADEAASEDGIRFRQKEAGAFFVVARSKNDELVGFVNGTLTAAAELDHDSMSSHDPKGTTLCIHSVVVDKAFRRQGFAFAMLKQYVRDVCEHQPQVQRIALIAKAYLVGFYVSCGFSVTRLSPVVHGQDSWFELVVDCVAARRLPIVQVDAFTSEPFQGNPAAVVLLSETAFHRDGAADWMLRVARENNLSETAFAALRSNQEASEAVEYDLKWFTPAAEVALCGHATLSTAVVLLDGGHVDPTQTIHFHTLSGVLVVRFEPTKTGGYLVQMDFPTKPLEPLPAHFSVDEIAAALGISRAGVIDAKLATFDVLVHVDLPSFRSLKPDFVRLGKMDIRGFTVTTNADPDRKNDADFQSRFFGPRVGIDEDPVTGSAHCALTPYWSTILGKRHLKAFQSTPVRGGYLTLELPESQPGRVLIKGEGVIVLRGSLTSSP